MRRLIAAVLLLALAPAALADESLTVPPRPRQGYFIGFGLRGALGYAREDGDTLGPMGGLGVGWTFGEMLTERLGLGLSMDFAGGSGDGQEATLAGLGLEGQVEIARNLALHASVGLGIFGLSSPEDDPDDDSRGVAGAGYTVGLSYDWFFTHRRSGGWALTPLVIARVVPGETDGFAAFFGLQITYWSGLTKNQLQLPPTQAW